MSTKEGSMRRRLEQARAAALALAVILAAAAPAGAIDGLPLGVELENAEAGTIGWVRIADDDGLEPQSLTIEAWVRPLGVAYSPTGDPVGARIVIKPMEGEVGSYLASYSLGLNLDETAAASVAHQLGSTGSTVSSTATAPQGERTHIAMSFDGTWLRVFVNGQLEGEEVTPSSTVDYGSEDVLIGAANLGSGYLRLFRGIVDDVRIWDHARDAAEIAAQMGCSLDGTEPGLLAYWSFNAGDLRDDSGNGHSGVAEGLVELVTSNDACLPFVAGFESGDLSEWSSTGG
jgi:hypothetical protein